MSQRYESKDWLPELLEPDLYVFQPARDSTGQVKLLVEQHDKAAEYNHNQKKEKLPNQHGFGEITPALISFAAGAPNNGGDKPYDGNGEQQLHPKRCV